MDLGDGDVRAPATEAEEKGTAGGEAQPLGQRGVQRDAGSLQQGMGCYGDGNDGYAHASAPRSNDVMAQCGRPRRRGAEAAFASPFRLRGGAALGASPV